MEILKSQKMACKDKGSFVHVDKWIDQIKPKLVSSLVSFDEKPLKLREEKWSSCVLIQSNMACDFKRVCNSGCLWFAKITYNLAVVKSSFSAHLHFHLVANCQHHIMHSYVIKIEDRKSLINIILQTACNRIN